MSGGLAAIDCRRWPGKPAPTTMLVDLARLERAYYERRPDPDDPAQRVALRHQRPSRLVARTARSPRPTSWRSRRPSATTAAAQGIDGPLYMGKDTHALSAPGRSGPRSRCSPPTASTPSSSATTASRRRPVISRAILVYNRGRTAHLADGIVITPSHNPPEDGGFKYNPPNGGPADTDVTRWIQDRANELLRDGQRGRQARCRSRARSRRRRRTRRTSSCPTSTTCGTSSTWTPSAPPA